MKFESNKRFSMGFWSVLCVCAFNISYNNKGCHFSILSEKERKAFGKWTIISARFS